MKIKTVALVAGLTLTGCASLHSIVYNQIHAGDTKDHVIEVLGYPDEFRPVDGHPEITGLLYKKRKDVCAIMIKDDVVIEVGCVNNPNYVNPVAAIFKGIGDGMTNGSRQKLRCTSTSDSAGNVITNCH